MLVTLGGLSAVALAAAGASAAPTFDPQLVFAAGDGPYSVAVGDFNADSDPDLAVANSGSDTVSVLLGAAGGTFGAATNHPAGDTPFSVAVGHFNADSDADSDADLAVANNGSDNVSVLVNSSLAAVSLSPPSLGFGAQLIDTTSRPKTTTVTNTGDSRLEVDDIRILGTHAGDFDIKKEGCTNYSFLVGDSCPITVTFTPSAAGARTASVRITSNAAGSPHTVPLSGNGAVPSCGGVDATIVGTDGPDVLTGTAGADIVALLEGDDSFRGGKGNDSVCGSSGDDEINGQGNDDTLRGGSGDDALIGGAGSADVCRGGSDIDTADAGCETTTDVP